MSVMVVLLGMGARGNGAGVEEEFRKSVVPVLEQYCYDCHGEGSKKGGLALDKFGSLGEHLKDTKHWLAVWKNVESQMMPPSEKPQLSAEKRRELMGWIEKAVFHVDPKNPDPGRVTVRRLNREEYRNSVLDLLGARFNTDEAFPADDTGYGFDTIGDVLSISPLLMEKYLEAAQEVVRIAIEENGPRIPVTTLYPGEFASAAGQKHSAKAFAFGTAAQFTKERWIEHPGRYRVRMKVRVGGQSEGGTQTAVMALKSEGKTLVQVAMDGGPRRELEAQQEVDFSKGKMPLVLELIPGTAPAEGQAALSAGMLVIEFTGPLDGSHMESGPSYKKVFPDGAATADATEREAYRRKILEYVAPRAFRRPVDKGTVDRLIQIAQDGEKTAGGRFEAGIGQALVALLASPRFLFRAEIQPEPNNPARVVPVDEYALASRLSYFLWSSLPDDELLRAAAGGELRKNLPAQVSRMLEDPRSQRLVRNFVGQWLQARDVETANVDVERILGGKGEDFRKARPAMRQETEMFFAHLIKEDRPLLELLGADYTFLNEPLARVYGVEGVKGQEMRKVALPEGSLRRAGILTQGSTLLVTSNPTRTSPVKRGLFILENILGTPAPPPPPDVPPLDGKKKGNLTMREMMEVHRADALCASCHARMDPLGLALENFNAVGLFREKDSGKPIDTAGRLITGEKFATPLELAGVIANQRREDFYRCLTEKMLTYGLGRGLEYYDTVTVMGIVDRLGSGPANMRSFLQQIVESAPFQMRRGDGSRLGAQ